MMKLRISAVHYELFQSDADWLDQHQDADYHELDRQIVLMGPQGERLYLSWCADPVQYCLGVGQASFFQQPAEVTRDVSDSSFWQGLIGKETTLTFLDKDHQVLCLSAGQEQVYCSSFDGQHWLMDVVRVSRSKPEFPE